MGAVVTRRGSGQARACVAAAALTVGCQALLADDEPRPGAVDASASDAGAIDGAARTDGPAGQLPCEGALLCLDFEGDGATNRAPVGGLMVEGGTGLTFVEGPDGHRAANFQGQAAALRIDPDERLSRSPLTVDARVKTTDLAAKQFLLDTDGRFAMWVDEAVLYCDDTLGGAAEAKGPQGFGDGLWHHVACVFGNDGIIAYVDGTAGAPRATPPPGSASKVAGVVGAETAIGGNAFAGSVDHLRIFPTALSAAEVKQRAGPPGG